MDAITINQAKQNIDGLIEQVIADADPTIICDDKGQKVVILSLDEYNSWQETLYLLSNPANADHLRRSIHEDKSEKAVERELIES